MAFDPAPALLCLNLRREHVRALDEVEAAPALARLARVLAEARASGWRVLHAFAARPRAVDAGHGALAGFEPAAQEPVFALLSVSALSEPHIEQAARTGLLIAGGAFSRCGLATVLSAQERNCRVSIVREACFAPSIDAVSAHSVLDVAMGRETSEWGKVICLQTRRS